jgi:aspartate 1-decarboxylase
MIEMLKSKIHRARVTATNLHYVGSITIDADLIREAGLRHYEKVLVANLNNGERFSTYVIEGEPGGGQIEINGAASRHASLGDELIIMAFGLVGPDEVEGFTPRIVMVDPHNRPTEYTF